MWIKIKGNLYNLSIIQQIFKNKKYEIILFYSLQQEKYEDFSTIIFDSEKERNKEFEKIEKMLLGCELCNTGK